MATGKLGAAVGAAVLLASCDARGSLAVPGAQGLPAAHIRSQSTIPQRAAAAATPDCPQIVDTLTCLALAVRNSGGSGPGDGLKPSELQTRYGLPSSTRGSGQIVAIVDAYDNPHIAKDLATYRTQYGLGTAAFNKYNQEGRQGAYPKGNTGWGSEEDLDVEMVSAACPKCTIDLVEADTAGNTNLVAAESEAQPWRLARTSSAIAGPASVRIRLISAASPESSSIERCRPRNLRARHDLDGVASI